MDGTSLRLVLSLFIDHSYNNAVTQYINYLGVPTITWIDDLWLFNSRSFQLESPAVQAKVTHELLCLALT